MTQSIPAILKSQLELPNEKTQAYMSEAAPAPPSPITLTAMIFAPLAVPYVLPAARPATTNQ
jgi:hypothetical protein